MKDKKEASSTKQAQKVESPKKPVKATNKNPLKKIFSKPSKKVAIFGCVSIFALSLIATLVTLAIINPEIQSGSLESDSIKIEVEQVNGLLGDYPEIQFSSTHRLKFASGKTRDGKSITTTADDYVEGENELKAYKTTNYFFFTLISKKPSTKILLVDREAPTPSIEEGYSHYVLLDNKVSVKIIKEADSSILLNGEAKRATTPCHFQTE